MEPKEEEMSGETKEAVTLGNTEVNIATGQVTFQIVGQHEALRSPTNDALARYWWTDPATGIQFKSVFSPEYSGHSLYLRGSDRRNDTYSMRVSVEAFAKVLAAVKAFNAHVAAHPEMLEEEGKPKGDEPVELALKKFGCQEANVRELLEALEIYPKPAMG